MFYTRVHKMFIYKTYYYFGKRYLDLNSIYFNNIIRTITKARQDRLRPSARFRKLLGIQNLYII